MKVFYFCRTGAGPSMIAAAIHLGIISPGRRPTTDDLKKLPLQPEPGIYTIGRINYIGADHLGNKIYTFGVGKETDLIKWAVTDLVKIFRVDNQCVLVDTSFTSNFLINWGQHFNGKLGLFLSARGYRHSYDKIACCVHHTLTQLSRSRQT